MKGGKTTLMNQNSLLKRKSFMSEGLNKLSVEELGALFPIVLKEYDPEWAKKFLVEKELILTTFNENRILGIHHIGSTSVPGLKAKATIDILLLLARCVDLKLMTDKLANIGYQFIPRLENPPPHMMLAKGYSKSGYTGQTFHIHPRFSGDWNELIFRDYLIGHSEISNEYAALKTRLSADHKNDREKYTISKSGFIENVIRKAREELKNKSYF
jgi:GrpB-like predicted nucleotidyltransferase (UPF0157 family)